MAAFCFIEFISIFAEWWWKQYNELSNQKTEIQIVAKDEPQHPKHIWKLPQSVSLKSRTLTSLRDCIDVHIVLRGWITHKWWEIYLSLHTDFCKLASVSSVRNTFVFSLNSVTTWRVFFWQSLARSKLNTEEAVVRSLLCSAAMLFEDIRKIVKLLAIFLGQLVFFYTYCFARERVNVCRINFI